MARKYANIYTGIWRQEDDFTDLSVHAQWAYMMLVSQPDISAAGVLSINLRRWTRRAKDSSRDLLVAALKELGEAKKIVYDQETEELLVRTFVKWDGGYGNPKRQPVIRRAVQDIESSAIRQALAGELTKLGFAVEGLTDSVPDSLSSQPDSLSGSQHEPATEGYGDGGVAASHRSSDQRESSQQNSLSATVSASDGVVVTQGLTDTATRTPQTADPPPVGGAGGGAKPKTQRSERGTRLTPDWQPDDSLLAWFREKKLGNAPLSSLVDLETETDLFRNYWLAKSGAGATKCDWGRTYQNWLLNSAKRASSGARASPGRHQAHQNNPNADYNEDL